MGPRVRERESHETMSTEVSCSCFHNVLLCQLVKAFECMRKHVEQEGQCFQALEFVYKYHKLCSHPQLFFFTKPDTFEKREIKDIIYTSTTINSTYLRLSQNTKQLNYTSIMSSDGNSGNVIGGHKATLSNQRIVSSLSLPTFLLSSFSFLCMS